MQCKMVLNAGMQRDARGCREVQMDAWECKRLKNMSYWSKWYTIMMFRFGFIGLPTSVKAEGSFYFVKTVGISG
jgi:hypothetical protein